MQTYFTELPSPALKHTAHKYTMKTFKNGKWKYFYDTITGRQKYRDAYDKAKKGYYSTMSNNILDNKTSEERIKKATRNTNKKLTEASIAGFSQGLRIYNAKQRGENTNNLYSQANESAKLWDHEVKKARAKQYDEVRKASGLKRSQESIMRAQDAKMAAAKRNYEMSVPERLSRSIKNKAKSAKNFVDTNITGKTYKDRAETFKSLKEKERKKTPLYPENNRNYARYDFAAQRAKSDYSRKSLFGKIESGAKKKTTAAKNSLADAFKKAKNLVRVENVRKTSSNLIPAGYQKVETVPKKKKKSK